MADDQSKAIEELRESIRSLSKEVKDIRERLDNSSLDKVGDTRIRPIVLVFVIIILIVLLVPALIFVFQK